MRLAVSPLVLASALLLPGAPASAQSSGDRYIVQYAPGHGGKGEAALRAAGGRIALRLGAQDAAAVHLSAHALAALARHPHIESIELDPVRRPLATWSDVPVGGEVLPYGIQMVQANRIVAPNASSRMVCIIDSGYSQQHVDLKDTTSGEVSANVFDAGSGTWDKDSCGHGTHVAGTVAAIAGNGTGVIGANPGTRIHVVKVFGDDNLAGGACGWTYASTLVDALNKCTAAGANVVSMSLGGPTQSRAENKAFTAAYNNGVLLVAAAGNDGSKRTSYPAGYASVMSVAAVDATETVATFSQRNKDVEIAAPGVAVLSTVPWIDTNTLNAGGTLLTGGRVEGAARTNGTTGVLANGGRCTAAGAWGGHVVLCQRGDNSFAEKVAQVQAGGGIAAVIYNNAASDPGCGVFLGTLGDSPTTTIPGITLSCGDGAAAVATAGAAGTVVSRLDVPNSGYEPFDGTSMATPHVSAAAALVWSCNPSWSNAQIRSALTATALDKGTAGRDTAYGFGIVQARSALQALGLGGCSVH
jgi:subtilisin family serine protease